MIKISGFFVVGRFSTVRLVFANSGVGPRPTQPKAGRALR